MSTHRQMERRRKFGSARVVPLNEEEIVGEILEDIECLELDDVDQQETNDLNDDTFGFGAQEKWDPTNTFLEAERNLRPSRPRACRENTDLEKFELDEFPLAKDSRPRSQRATTKSKRSQAQKSSTSTTTRKTTATTTTTTTSATLVKQKPKTDVDERVKEWKKDLESIKKLGLHEINDEFLTNLANGRVTIPRAWQVDAKTLQRHFKGVLRSPDTIERELFINEHEFDQILRIHLAQISKNPRLQNFSGKWNIRHLGLLKQDAGDGVEAGDEDDVGDETSGAVDASAVAVVDADVAGDGNVEGSGGEENEKGGDGVETVTGTGERRANVSKRFGKTSSASVRHGRRLIQLFPSVASSAGATSAAASGDADEAANGPSSTAGSAPASSSLSPPAPTTSESASDAHVNGFLPCVSSRAGKSLRFKIENCYQALYAIGDIEQEIEKCPMNHMAALDKLQKLRDERLQDLYMEMTSDGNHAQLEHVLNLDKGLMLVTKTCKKLGIENKVQLCCLILKCPSLVMCLNVVDAIIGNEPSGDFIAEFGSAKSLKPLVAFEGFAMDQDQEMPFSGLYKRLLTFPLGRLYLMLLETIALAGHLFLIADETGRKTGLQVACNVLTQLPSFYSDASVNKEKGRLYQILEHKSGLALVNVLLQRIQNNPGSVATGTINVLVNQVLDISQDATTNRAEWNALAASIMHMVKTL